MNMDIVLITRDRPELTEQTIRSMVKNATDWSKHQLQIIVDYSDDLWASTYDLANELNLDNIHRHHANKQQLGVGGAKNLGVELLTDWRVKQFKGSGFEPVLGNRLLMFTDNDMYYLPGWDKQLEFYMNGPYFSERGERATQLGGWRHPFHILGREIARTNPSRGVHAMHGTHAMCEVDAATGNCFVIRWTDWLKYGPFDSNALGPGQSEDYALSQKIKSGGGLVATLDPPIAIHCGMINSEGKLATGWAEMLEMAMRQLHQYGLEDEVMLAVPNAVTDQAQIGSKPIGQAADCNPAVVGSTPTLPSKYTMGLPPVIDKPYIDPKDGVEKGRVRMEFASPFAFPGYDNYRSRGFVGLNIGSGQRPFDRTYGWVNVDAQSVPPNRVPDIVCAFGSEPLPSPDASVDMVALVHSLEHFGCSEGAPFIREAFRVLKPGGSLVIIIPDMRKLAARWLGGEITEYIFAVNTYGAFMSSEFDRHRWMYTRGSLETFLRDCSKWSTVTDFDYRPVPGSAFPADWWMLAVEAIK